MSSHVYYRPSNGHLARVCVWGGGAVFKYNQDITFTPPNSHQDQEPKPPNLTGHVTSLYDHCLALLATLTHCFESLVDFPPDFGHTIFSLAVPHLTTDSKETSRSLTTFCEAYPALMLPSCSLKDSLLLLNSYDQCLPSLLSATTTLDLSHCSLDDQHDLLPLLACLSSLASLGLAYNLLTDQGLARLVLPRRLAGLARLDWSGNSLGVRGVARLQACGLSRLVLLERQLEGGLAKVLVGAGWRRAARPVLERVGTEGWAGELLEAWRTSSGRKTPRPKNTFYSRPVLKPLEQGKAEEGNKVMFNKVVKDGALKKPFVQDLLCKRKAETINEGEAKKSKTNFTNENNHEQELLKLYM